MGVSGVGALAALPWLQGRAEPLSADWQPGERYARVAVGKVDIYDRPSFDGKKLSYLYEDQTTPWLSEVIGDPNLNYGKNRRWVQTPKGFIYSPHLQETFYNPNTPLSALPTSDSGRGMWAEITVPEVDVSLANPPAHATILKKNDFIFRMYYKQVYWIDDVRTVDGTVQYHVIERHGSPGDEFWVDATAFRQIPPDELSPTSPDRTDKRIVVNVSKQTLSCYEGKSEVYFSRVSTGAKFDMYGNAVDKWSTPLGLNHAVTRKYISLHMAGGSAASGYELFAVSWTSIFATGGVAIHSTYWHNNYGEPMSHGCVNANPDAAKWVFLWTLPNSPYDPGKIEQSGYGGTKVQVVEGV